LGNHKTDEWPKSKQAMFGEVEAFGPENDQIPAKGSADSVAAQTELLCFSAPGFLYRTTVPSRHDLAAFLVLVSQFVFSRKSLICLERVVQQRDLPAGVQWTMNINRYIQRPGHFELPEGVKQDDFVEPRVSQIVLYVISKIFVKDGHDFQ